MFQYSLPLVLGALLLSSAANATHPKIDECGGFNANRGEGVHNAERLSADVEHRIERYLRTADATPGAAVVIVIGEEIVYARGFGFRDLASCAKAASNTRFYLKSTTKTLLGLSAAQLHEEGAIELDAPIAEYLPDLKLPEGLSSQQVSVRSHIIHTQPYFDAGLNYRTAFPGNLPESEFVEHANEFSVVGDIKFRYSNFGPIIAAHAITAKTGIGWRELIAHKVFEPVGMKNSFTSMAAAEEGPMATAHLGAQSEFYRPTLTKIDAQMHAAGGAVSTAEDLGRLLIVMMNEGRIDGEQVLAQRAVEQTQARQVQLSTTFAEFARFAYGLGLYAADYDGDLLMHHFGGETHFSFMSEHDIGVAVLSNEPFFGGQVTHGLASTIYDLLLEKSDIDARIERRLQAISDAKSGITARLNQYVGQLRESAPVGEPMFSADDILGTYTSSRLGSMNIGLQNGELRLDFGALSGPLTHISGDGYIADFNLWGDPPELFVFRDGDDGVLVLDWGGRVFAKQ